MNTKSIKGKHSNLRRSPVAHACLTFSMLLAAGAANAAAGWGDSFGPNGAPLRVRTYYAHTPSGPRVNVPPEAGTYDNTIGTGAALRKFIDPLPGVGKSGATLADSATSKYIPAAVPTPWTNGNGVVTKDEYYEIAVVEYKEKMHSDLRNPTTLRGYVQIYPKSAGAVADGIALQYPDSTLAKPHPITFTTGEQVYAYDNPHYLGPAIVAKRGTAVRLKFYNFLPVGHFDATSGNRNGDLAIPVDTTLAGAGVGPDGLTAYTQNRAEIHLHGGDTPWISDGTPHQWLTPAGEGDESNPLSLAATMKAANGGVQSEFLGSYIKGVSQQNVPDMPAPEAGAGTYYFPNNQSGRLMFYHDHSFGLTRLNVYAGEAAPYILLDDRQEAILNTVPGFPDAAHTIPLVIQDKTFVPADIALQDGLWNNTNANHPADGLVTPKAVWGGESDMWYPHVYEINQDPSNGQDGTNAVGRWDWGPYFWPVFPAMYNIPSGAVDDVTITPEAWMDTPLVNGVAYPYAAVDPKAYRLKILNAANDRMWNLSFFVADAAVSRIEISNGGSGYVANVPAVPAVGTTLAVPAVINTPVTFSAPEDPKGVPATGEAIVVNGAVVGINVTNAGSGYALAPTVTITGGDGNAKATAVAFTEAKMVPAVPQNAQASIACPVDAAGSEIPPSPSNQCWPSEWPTDGRDGGVPDPLTAGPSWLQIGSEGGLLPQVAKIDAKPMGYEYNRRSITVLNAFTFGLFLGNAERADTVVDFSAFAGKTLIMYNDSPAPVPAFDPRNDHWTGKPDETTAGSVESPRPGYGPNTRTVMQFRVGSTGAAAAIDVPTLNTQLAAAYAATQEKPVVAQSAYNKAFGTTYSDAPHADGTKAFATIFTGSLQEPTFKFTPGDSNGVFSSIELSNEGGGYMKPPAVTISAPSTGGVQATAVSSLRISRVRVDTAGSGYVVAPLVRFSNLPITDNNGNALLDPVTGLPLVANGSGAQGITTLKVVGANIVQGGTGYKIGDRLNLAFAPPTSPTVANGGVRAAGYVTVKTVKNGAITALNNPVFTGTGYSAGFGYASAPGITVTTATGAGTGAKLTTLAGVGSILLTSPNPKKPTLIGGGGYDDLNFISVVFSTPNNVTPATATVTGGSVFDVTLKHKGSGYTTAPTVTLASPPTGTGNVRALASAKTGGSILVKSKAIQELFDPTYGRMNATLGIELPFTSAMSQTTIPLGYVDPLTEEFDDGETQIWKITHNGVDSHPVHFHLLNVQVINRIGWDGTIKPPQANEYGWKETIKMHPLEDIMVAVRAKKPIIGGELQADGSIKETTASFGVPLSYRLRDPSQPEGSPAGFTQIDPATGLPATIVNGFENYGWEYVWHCHILGHEENDFMRAVKFNANEAKPAAPSNIVATYDNNNQVTLAWTDNAVSEFNYQVSRSPAMAAGTATLLANANGFVDASPIVAGTNYTYTVTANGAAGGNSNTVVVALPSPPAAPSNLTVTAVANLGANITFCDNANNETSFQLMRDTGAGYVPFGTALPAHAGTTTQLQCNGFAIGNFVIVPATPVTGAFSSALVAGVVNKFELIGINQGLQSTPSNVVTVDMTTPAAPATAAVSQSGSANLTVTWGAVTGATSYLVELSVNGGAYSTIAPAATGTSFTTTSNLVTSAGGTFQVRVTAVKTIGGNAVPSTAKASSVLTVQPAVAPSAPTGLTRSMATINFNFTQDNATVSWTASATGTAPSYVVQYSTNGGTSWNNGPTVTTTTATFKVNKRSGGTVLSYVFRVQATNVAGSATSAATASITAP